MKKKLIKKLSKIFTSKQTYEMSVANQMEINRSLSTRIDLEREGRIKDISKLEKRVEILNKQMVATLIIQIILIIAIGLSWRILYYA